MKKVNKRIHHINNYGTEINDTNKKSLNEHNYFNFYHDTFNFRNNDIPSNSQQTGITNNITETNTQTTNYIDASYFNNNNNNKIATVIVNPTPSLNEHYLWIPEVSDNVAPGLDSLITYTQSTYATLAALQNAMANIIIFKLKLLI